MVTILTDGLENASKEYDQKAIKSLVEELKSKGWVFAFMGANQNVEEVAFSLSIQNHILFDASPAGTNQIFACYHKSYDVAMDAVHDGEDLEDSFAF